MDEILGQDSLVLSIIPCWVRFALEDIGWVEYV